MLTSQKFIHLTEATALIALRSPYGAVRGTEICESLKLPARYLEPEFQNLVKAKILKSVRGPKGGYVLAREKRNITLQDIYLAMQKPEKAKTLSAFGGFLAGKMEAMENDFAKTTLHDLITEASAKKLIKTGAEKPDFTI